MTQHVVLSTQMMQLLFVFLLCYFCPFVPASKTFNGQVDYVPEQTLSNLSAGRQAQYFLQ